MSDLEYRLKNDLESILQLKDPRERISAYHDMPYALFRYGADEEFELRRQVTLLETRLTQNGKRVKRISLAACLNEAMGSQRPLEEWFTAEREQGVETIVETVHSVLSEYSPLVDLVAARLFIALASRCARSWLFSEHGKVVEGYQLDWALNVGLPASSWGDEATRTLYRSLALAGWRLGCSGEPITFAGANGALLSVESGAPASAGQLVWEMVEAVPEFGAQIHSYRCSAQRQRDLHLLVDVGAGTVDIVTFHIGDEIDTEIPVNCIMESTVLDLGTHVLLRQRAQAGSLSIRVWDDAATSLSRSDFERHCSLQTGALVRVQEEFADRLDRAIRKVLLTTQRERYATSPAWKSGMPFFLTGGGRTVDAYREAVAETQRFRKLIEVSLPVPGDTVLGKVGRSEFHRVSVAHGLSFPALNLAKTLGKDEVPPLTLPKALREDYRDSYIEK